jgi:hypothetical protein
MDAGFAEIATGRGRLAVAAMPIGGRAVTGLD